MSERPNIEEIADGLALWDEHKPQSGEDWLAVAKRFVADGGDTSYSSPLFKGLALAVSALAAAEARAERIERERQTLRRVIDRSQDCRALEAAEQALREIAEVDLFPDPYICQRCKRLHPYLDLMGEPQCVCGSSSFWPARTDEAETAIRKRLLPEPAPGDEETAPA